MKVEFFLEYTHLSVTRNCQCQLRVQFVTLEDYSKIENRSFDRLIDRFRSEDRICSNCFKVLFRREISLRNFCSVERSLYGSIDQFAPTRKHARLSAHTCACALTHCDGVVPSHSNARTHARMHARTCTLAHTRERRGSLFQTDPQE